MTALYKKISADDHQKSSISTLQKLENFVQDIKDKTADTDFDSLEREIHLRFKEAEQAVIGNY